MQLLKAIIHMSHVLCLHNTHKPLVCAQTLWLFVLHQVRQKQTLRSDMSWVLMWIKLAWRVQTGNCCLKPVCFESNHANLIRDMILSTKIKQTGEHEYEQKGQMWGLQMFFLHNKDRYCVSASLMAVCIHSHSWLWEIEMIYMHFSSIWGTIKHWCWYPSGNVDRIAFLPTVYLPAASSAGCMHQNWVWHDVTFHLRALESHRYRLCPLPLSLFLSVCVRPLPLSFSEPKAYNLSSGEIGRLFSCHHGGAYFSWSPGSRGFQ